jgi:hypothetical protein
MKEEGRQSEVQMAIPVTISIRPREIDIKDIEINQGECFISSYRVAKKYPSVEIVEGIIVSVNTSNGATPLAHVWNKKGDVHFDVTKEKIWTGREELLENKEIKYFMVKCSSEADFKNGDLFEFSYETQENIKAISEILNKNSEKKNEEHK